MEEKTKDLSILACNNKLREIMQRICTLQEITDEKLHVSRLYKEILQDKGAIEAIGEGTYKINITEEQVKDAIEIAEDEKRREEVERRESKKVEGKEFLDKKKRRIEDDLYVWMKEVNIPREDVSEGKIYLREVAVGFLRSKLMDREELYSKRGFITKNVYVAVMKKNLSRKNGFLRSNLVLFIDCICAFDDEAWIIELKKKLNHTALGQVLVYKDLFLEDYPDYSNVKMGIVCNESSPLIEPVCKKFSVEVFERGESFQL